MTLYSSYKEEWFSSGMKGRLCPGWMFFTSYLFRKKWDEWHLVRHI